MQCLDENELAALAGGSLDETEAREIEAHLDQCASCLLAATEVIRAQTIDTHTRSGAVSTSGGPIARGTIMGRYLVEDLVGSGAMGTVYAAYDAELERRVAIKVVRAAELGARTRLLREARALAKVADPHVVAVHDVGMVDEGVFIAMELVEGVSLREWLASPRTWREVVATLTKAGRGLAAIHRARIVHRDFKPANVLVGRDGAVKVADFGLATAARAAEADVVGTPAYMAPEQRAGVVDERADQYSFAVVLRQALADKRSPAWVRRVVQRGTRTEPGARFPSMDALVDALADDPRVRRRLVTAGILLALAIGALGWSWKRHEAMERQRCAVAAGAIDEAWNQGREARAFEAFSRSGLSYAKPSMVTVSHALGAYVQGWRTQRWETCEAGQRAPSPLLERQDACLEDRRVELDALAALFEHADAKTVQSALPAVSSLVPVQTCKDARDRSPFGADAIKHDLARAKALNATGKIHDARLVAHGTVDAARAMNDPWLEARALYLHGFLLGLDGDYKGGEAALLEAATRADAAADDRTRAQAWVELLHQVGYQQQRYESVSLFDHEAKAAIDRFGGDALLDARRRSLLALILKNQGRYEDAHDEIMRAFILKSSLLRSDDDELAGTWVNIGTIDRQSGQYKEAIAAFREALDIYVRARGGDAPATIVVQNDLADALLRSGAPHAALEAADGALGTATRQLAPDHPTRSLVLARRADVENALGHHEEAVANAIEAVEIAEKRFGKDGPRLYSLLTTLGNATLDSGDAKGALAILERANALGSTDPMDRADLAFALARAVVATHGDVKRARSLASGAEAAFRARSDLVAADAVAAWRTSP